MKSRGVTIVELLVALVVMAFLGIALARILINDSRFVSKQDAMLVARQAARAAMNTVGAELRMVGANGVTAAAAKQVTVRLPYAFGMLCRSFGTPSRVGLVMPTDSVAYASAIPGGMAWRDSAGVFNFVSPVTVTTSSDPTACTTDSIRVGITGARLISVNPKGLSFSGSVFYLYENVTYRFATSVAIPGRIALWRRSGTAADEELVVPFDTSAGFRFLVGPNLTAVASPPPLDSIRGFELKLVAASEATPKGTTGPQTFDLRTRVAFLNKP